MNAPGMGALFTLREPVGRRTYIRVGAGLMLLKYLVDATAIGLMTGRFWTPLDYLNPLMDHGATARAIPAWLSVALVVWTLPFLWVGVSMTMRRAVDAGRSPWWCLAFFLPLFNYLVMLWLSVAPSSPLTAWAAGPMLASASDRWRSAALGVGAGLAVGLLAVLVTVHAMESYGLALFLATPFVIGVVAAYAFNHAFPRKAGETMQVVGLSLLIIGGSLVLFALEGVLCVAMALPLGAVVAYFGAEIGRAIAIRSKSGWQNVAFGLLLIPGAAAVDATRPVPPLREIVTSIIIDAPRERVWEEVIAFRAIGERPGLAFRLGIAYPVRASISGTGVGAVRRCEFSTGAFVEPITAWDAPSRLAFDVAEQPPVLQEWSPYRAVYAPHLDGFFRSTRGEFRLVALPDGRTRLEGSTWYALDIHPRIYWRVITESLLHRIHARVLEQVKRQAEATPAVAATAPR